MPLANLSPVVVVRLVRLWRQDGDLVRRVLLDGLLVVAVVVLRLRRRVRVGVVVVVVVLLGLLRRVGEGLRLRVLGLGRRVGRVGLGLVVGRLRWGRRRRRRRRRHIRLLGGLVHWK